MLLALEVGNTNTKIGVFDGAHLLTAWRLTSRREQTADEYGVFIETLLRARGLEPTRIRGVAISNVVPPVQQTLEWMAEQYFGLTPFSVEPGVNTEIPLVVDDPREVGADRVVKAYAARALYGAPLIIVDVGTATTFDCVGAIAPGLSTAADALINRAARLFRVELVRPKEAIGRNTVTNMQSGFVYGWAGLIDGLVERMRGEMDGEPKVVATGGLVSVVASAVRAFQVTNEHLALEGIRLLWERHHAG